MKHPLLKDLDDGLKSLTAYKKIEGDMIRIMHSDHSHQKVSAFMKCKRCQEKMAKKSEYLKSKGFKDYQQYLAYRQVMQVMYKELKRHEQETAKGGK